MTSSARQKRQVVIIAILSFLVFGLYAFFTKVPLKTDWKFKEYGDGYMIVEYKHAFTDKNTAITVPSVHKGKAVVAIGDKAFYENRYITEVTVPDSVEELGSSVFKKCKKLKKVYLPDSILIMGGACFQECTSLTEVHLPQNLKDLRGETFVRCRSLQYVELPAGITEIRGNTFEHCSSLVEIEIPMGVTRIGGHAFYACTSLSDVFVPDTVKEIGSSAFRRCDSLYLIRLPDGVDINERAFKESPTRIEKKFISDKVFKETVEEIQKREIENWYLLVDIITDEPFIEDDGSYAIADSEIVADYFVDTKAVFMTEEQMDQFFEDHIDSTVIAHYYVEVEDQCLVFNSDPLEIKSIVEDDQE